MKEKKVGLKALALAMSLGFMTTIAGCEINPDGGGEGGEGGEGAEGGEQGTVIEQPEYVSLQQEPEVETEINSNEYENN